MIKYILVKQKEKITIRGLEKIGIAYLGKNKDGKYKQPKLANAILKYGWDSFILEKTINNLTNDEANNLERYYIKLYNSNGDGGYNLSDGGKSGFTFTMPEETVKEMALRAKESYNYESHYKKIYQFDKNSLELLNEWPSIISAANALNISSTAIIGCCRRRSLTAAGYIWSYEKDLDIDKFYNRKNKRVFQLDMDGNVITSYYSVVDAARETGIKEQCIRSALAKRYYSSGGFRWSYTKAPTDREFKIQSKNIYMFSKNGEYIREYSSISEAASDNNVTPASISEAAKETTKLRTSAGYIWSYSKVLPTERLDNKKIVPVLKYSKNGELLDEYDSIKEASIENNIDKSLITKCCKGKIKTSGGYVWKYKALI